MNTAQIKRVAMAAAIFAGAGAAFAGPYSDLHVVFCKATILGDDGGTSENSISVTLPPTEGYYDMDGTPLTYWNVGNVPSGGVADSWHAEGGPGRFTAKNAGTRGAYFYVATAGDNYTGEFSKYDEHWSRLSDDQIRVMGSSNVWSYVDRYETFGSDPFLLRYCAISPSELRRWRNSGSGEEFTYHLAFTTDVTAKVPTWHSLDHWLVPVDNSSGNNSSSYTYWHTEETNSPSAREVFGFMGYVDAGDYLTFDLKFWAPRHTDTYPVLFTFCVEAAAYPLWDHGLAVE